LIQHIDNVNVVILPNKRNHIVVGVQVKRSSKDRLNSFISYYYMAFTGLGIELHRNMMELVCHKGTFHGALLKIKRGAPGPNGEVSPRWVKIKMGRPEASLRIAHIAANKVSQECGWAYSLIRIAPIALMSNGVRPTGEK
jgi:hypothetical protein